MPTGPTRCSVYIYEALRRNCMYVRGILGITLRQVQRFSGKYFSLFFCCSCPRGWIILIGSFIDANLTAPAFMRFWRIPFSPAGTISRNNFSCTQRPLFNEHPFCKRKVIRDLGQISRGTRGKLMVFALKQEKYEKRTCFYNYVEW